MNTCADTAIATAGARLVLPSTPMVVPLCAALPPRLRPAVRSSALMAVIGLATACQEAKPPAAPPKIPVGRWYGTLRSPGGAIPFQFDLAANGSGTLFHGSAQTEFSKVAVHETGIDLSFDWYDAVLKAAWTEPQKELAGTWEHGQLHGKETLPFRASRKPPAKPVSSAHMLKVIDGDWVLRLAPVGEKDPPPESAWMEAVGEFRATDDGLRGTVLTPLGDMRFLTGHIDKSQLSLHTFDGAYATLIRAQVSPPSRAGEVAELVGRAWFGAFREFQIQGHRADQPPALPKPRKQTKLLPRPAHLIWRFPDHTGRIYSSESPRFRDKVVVIEVLGTWCPNCSDQAAVMVRWADTYRKRGLEVVGLAFEYSDDFDKAATQVERYRKHHDIRFPILIAGTVEAVPHALPQLSGLEAFPTTILIDRKGDVRHIHTGFAGPSSRRHAEMVHALEEKLIELLDEPAPQ